MKLRIAVLSDLHATGHAENNPSSSYMRAHPRAEDPDLFSDLKETIQRESLTVDLLVCPGDICDKGDQIGFTYAWSQLNSLISALNATELIATCGNHDLDSRYAAASADDDPDPKGALLQASPPFPFGETEDTNHFWARDYAIRQPHPGVTVVVLNTSAYHGGATGELNYGRVSSRTIKAILGHLKTRPSTELNILICHHHLQPSPGWGNTADDEFVKRGVDLLAALSAQSGSTWLVIHGHRHIPQVLSSVSPSFVSIGAASFSKIGDRFSNQFHIIEIESDPHSPTMPLRGEINTWNWSRPKKWAKYNDPTRGLPPKCGFGYSGAPLYLATKVKAALGSSPFMSWDAVTSAVPEIRYLTPLQFESFQASLRATDLEILSTENGIPNQLGGTV